MLISRVRLKKYMNGHVPEYLLTFAAPIPTLVVFMKLLPFVISSLNAAHMYAHACVYRCYSQVRLKALPVNNIRF